MFEKWWGKDLTRLDKEEMEMNYSFPDFNLFKNNEGQLVWAGYLTTEYGVRNYYCWIIYPNHYPYSSPEARIVEPKISDSPHFYYPDRPCLSITGSNTSFSSGKYTAKDVVADLAVWLWAQETWESTGTWPAKGHD